MSGLLRGRLCVVAAAAGYGKTSAVRQWLGELDRTGEILVVDDVRPGDPPVPLGAARRLVLISRWPVPVATLLRYGLGAPVEIGPRELALPPQRVARLLSEQYGVDDIELAARVHRLTAGWPVLAHFAGARLVSGQAGSPLEDTLAGLGSPLADYVRHEVLASLPDEMADLLAHVVEIGSMSTELAGTIGRNWAARELVLLSRLGLLIPPAAGEDLYRPVPVMSPVVRDAVRLEPARRRMIIDVAADWHDDHGRPAEALRLALARGDHARGAHLLTTHGAALLAEGAAADVLAAVELLPASARGDAIDLLHADALQATGNVTLAVAGYARLAGERDELPPALAWRYGAAVYMWGDSDDALAILRRGRLSGSPGADEAILLAWTAAAHWLTGNESGCGDHAARAYEIAATTDDSRALASAHVALALTAHLTGDPVGLAAHYGRALQLAEDCGDTVQVLRIRVNLAAGLEQEGRLAEALAVLGPAVELARSVGLTNTLALALANEGALLHRLGRLDDAAASYQLAVQAYQRMHSQKVAYPLTGLGDLHRERGQVAQAKAAYQEALRAAIDDGNNRQGMVPALAGLARLVAETDALEAAELAERAVGSARGHWVTTALVARAWVAWHASRPADVRKDAEAAADVAARHRNRTGLAQALEVRAAGSDDPSSARQALLEALAIWTDSGAEVEADRIRVALSRLEGCDDDRRLLGRLAESRLVAAGVVPPPVRAPGAPAQVEIRVLGGFTVLVNGRALPPAAWQSRKARELLRVLIARRGRPVPRDELADLLWGPVPAAERDKVSHRLSVALSTLRTVLDPGRCASADYYIVASQNNIAVDLGRLTLDVEDLFAQARYGFRLRERGELTDAVAVLAAADGAYRGDAFADDPYQDSAVPLREEARATHLRILRALVELTRQTGEIEDTVQYLGRLLSVDPYDEQAHRDLVGALFDAGRHGEASRAFRRYAEAMHELGIPVRTVREL